MAFLSTLVNQMVAGETRRKRINRSLAKIDLDSLKPSVQECSICREPLQSKETNTVDDFDWSTMTITEILRHRNERIIPELPMRLISCGHIFGDSCITHWLTTAETCPTCRHTALAPPIVVTPGLQNWRQQRGDMFQRTEGSRWRDNNPSPRRHVLAQRVVGFIERETSHDEVPHGLMREVCARLAQNPESLVDGDLEALVDERGCEDGENQDDFLRWMLEWRFFLEEEVERVVMVVRAEVAVCAAIMSACPGLRG